VPGQCLHLGHYQKNEGMKQSSSMLKIDLLFTLSLAIAPGNFFSYALSGYGMLRSGLDG